MNYIFRKITITETIQNPKFFSDLCNIIKKKYNSNNLKLPYLCTLKMLLN